MVARIMPMVWMLLIDLIATLHYVTAQLVRYYRAS